MILIVCGGRAYADRERVFAALDTAHAKHPVSLLIHGGAPGADALAQQWAVSRAVKVRQFPAEWTALGRRAGPLRNQAMADHGADGCVAFPGGSGTADMCRRAEAAGIKVWKPWG